MAFIFHWTRGKDLIGDQFPLKEVSMVSRSSWLWWLGCISLLILGVGAYFFSRSSVKNYPLQQQNGPIVLFGDSLAAGIGASESGGGLAGELSKKLNEPVLNLGVSGETTHQALDRMQEVKEVDPRLVILILGGNDFLQRIDRKVTRSNLTTLVTNFQNGGAIVLLLGVRSGIVSGGSDELYEEVMEETGAAYEEDILKGIFGHPELMSDAIHPNDRGYAKIAERLMSTIKKLLGN